MAMISPYSETPHGVRTAPQSYFEIQEDSSNGDTLADRYQMLEELGSGSFGIVYKAIEKATGEIVAIKHVDLESSEEDLSDILSELSVLSSCCSPHVTKYRLAFLRRQTLWIVMEYLGGGSCADLLKPPPHRLSESHIAIICRELLLGLAYLHSEGKLHRDIKAANVLLGMDGRVKLADFGVAAQLMGLKSVRNTFVGTPFWMAPEVIQQEGHDAKADVWSLGITAMELAHGEPPHANVHPMKVLFLIPKQPAPRLEGTQWSKDFKDFVACCLTKDVDRRKSAKELLSHRFIRSAGKIEGLQELILRKQDWEASKGGDRNLKYYAETLKNLSQGDNDDGWVFETIKAVPTMNLREAQTQKKRKVSRTTVDVMAESKESATQMMQKLSLERRPEPDQSPTKLTMRKVSESKQQQYQSDRRDSVDSLSGKRTGRKRLSNAQPRHPLGVNMSFGNSPSTVRQFRRVSPSISVTPDENEDPNSSVIRTPSKAKPGIGVLVDLETSLLSKPDKGSRFSTATTLAMESKEANLGKKLYSHAIGLSCQDILNDTADEVKREAVARLAEAFSDLESVDPDGMYHIVSSIISKMKQDDTLKLMLPQPVPASPQKVSRSQSSELVASPEKPATANESRQVTPSTPTKSGQTAKLVLAQNNPHLKSHRRRQSAQAVISSRSPSRVNSTSASQVNSPLRNSSAEDKKVTGGVDETEEKEMMKGLVGGLEHTRQLGESLFDRWCEGLRVRWPAV
ncbi:STE/STE20/YSK protein kinase [Cladophialophora yegresii CBS 114405]|uniref:non-specific serine/threonine protein kinase n=1 Tax=Cladophialophora yegresii CBS 114405 TaxID=1182544 RepID=W9W8K5_9EURO|nr:STE/STE20/YSK protein kinase [Cladophialophora yegresii CBS 114405]EXJ60841.1 STE/STE20/YSK protein kinase [Cladophialophora yegresii CBS 114405]